MSNDDESDHGVALPAAAAALSPEERTGLVNELKNKLQTLAGQHADILETLSPNVRKRVEVLREIQSEHDALEKKFLEERAALEAKYLKLYEPLYTKRYEIVNGIVKVEGDTKEVVMDKEGDDREEKGVPEFWLKRLQRGMRGRSSILKISSGAESMILRVSSWNFSLILTLILRILSWVKLITWLMMRMNPFWRKQLERRLNGIRGNA